MARSHVILLILLFLAIPFLFTSSSEAQDLEDHGKKEALILATAGTIGSRIYQGSLEDEGITCTVLEGSNNDDAANQTMRFIYGDFTDVTQEITGQPESSTNPRQIRRRGGVKGNQMDWQLIFLQ